MNGFFGRKDEVEKNENTAETVEQVICAYVYLRATVNDIGLFTIFKS